MVFAVALGFAVSFSFGFGFDFANCQLPIAAFLLSMHHAQFRLSCAFGFFAVAYGLLPIT